MARHLETELKYDAPDSFSQPDLTGLPGCTSVTEPRTDVLIAEYYDTADLRLAARGITLRRRRGGADEGWHLKVPAGRNTKIELHAPISARTLPAKLSRTVAAVTRGERLRRVAVLETRRTTVRLLDMSGETLAEFADDTVHGSRVDDPDGVVSWRELEVEAGPTGTPEFLAATGKRLRKAGARRSESSSKLSRVLPPPSPAPGTGLPEGSAGAAVLDYLAEQVQTILALDPLARMAEPDAVHRMRVAVRRTRSLLRSYDNVLDRERTEQLQPELRWLAAELGVVRDLEVLRERFTGRLDGLPEPVAAHREWLDRLAVREQSAYRRLNRSLAGTRYFALLDGLDALVSAPPLTDRAAKPADKELRRAIDRAWARMVKAYEAAPGAPDPLEARHEVRKDAKRARYTAEAAIKALGREARDIARDAETLQETLGGYQDGVIAQHHLAEAARGASPEEAFTIGVVWGVEHALAQAALHEVPAVWDRVTARHC